MKKVTKIEPQAPIVKPRRRVAAYARVSMETERLQHSLSAQVSYYNDFIQKNPDWLFVGVYADNGISGTGTEKRAEFIRLLADCDAGKIDLVLTKSISRFARNTVDLLETVRHLKEIGVEVWFERENIHSMSGDGELMLSILASFAQEESRSISDNVKWGTRKRFEEGIPNGKFRVYGYRWEGDDLLIVPEEAAVVRRIFQNFLDGKSRLETEREFAAEGIMTRSGCRWVDSNIKQVLCNCTYTGDMLLQKEYINDPITKKRKKNRGELPQYLVPNHHEAIIDRETFDFVQAEMARRKDLGALANKSLNITCFTGKLKCPHCGVSLMHTRDNGHGNHGTEDYWKCGTTKKAGGRCPVRGGIRDDKLREACARALGLTEFDEQIFLDRVDFISVPESYKTEIHMKDGAVIMEDCTPTGHQDCWTQEARDKVSAYRRSHPALGKKGASCFTGKIQCGDCGNNFQRQNRHNRDGNVGIWMCATRKNDSKACSMHTIREDVLQKVCCDALGMETFDPAVFSEMVDRITATGKGTVTIVMTDGTGVDVTFDARKKMPPTSEESRKKRSESAKARWTPERRQEESERMKRIRKERGRNWRKT